MDLNHIELYNVVVLGFFPKRAYVLPWQQHFVASDLNKIHNLSLCDSVPSAKPHNMILQIMVKCAFTEIPPFTI
jgi:hypothetical protein